MSQGWHKHGAAGLLVSIFYAFKTELLTQIPDSDDEKYSYLSKYFENIHLLK